MIPSKTYSFALAVALAAPMIGAGSGPGGQVTSAEGWSVVMGPTAWYGQSPDGFTVGKDTTVSHSGHASGFIQSTTDNFYGVRALTQGIRADAYRGRRVLLQGFVKTSGLNGWAGLWVQVNGKDRELGFNYRGDVQRTRGSDWTPYSVTIDVPPDATTIFFGSAQQGTGRSWVDDLSFDTVDSALVSMSNNMPPAGYKSYLPEPENMDFTEPPVSGAKLDIPGWTCPTGKWGDWCHLDTQETRDGKPTAALNSYGTMYLAQDLLAQAYRGKRVRFEAYVKAEEGTEAEVALGIPGGGTRVVSPVNPQAVRGHKPAPEWKLVSADIVVPEWAEGLVCFVMLQKPGKAWVSDAKLEVVGSDANSAWMTEDAVKQLPLSPSNLDFERYRGSVR